MLSEEFHFFCIKCQTEWNTDGQSSKKKFWLNVRLDNIQTVWELMKIRHLDFIVKCTVSIISINLWTQKKTNSCHIEWQRKMKRVLISRQINCKMSCVLSSSVYFQQSGNVYTTVMCKVSEEKMERRLIEPKLIPLSTRSSQSMENVHSMFQRPNGNINNATLNVRKISV